MSDFSKEFLIAIVRILKFSAGLFDKILKDNKSKI